MTIAARTLRIGYVPEHYLLPLHLSLRQVPKTLKIDLIPFPSGTGHMITSLRTPSNSPESIDLAIGLTEGWIAGLLPPNLLPGKKKGYNIIGQWVKNPLRWAVVTGKNRDNIGSVSDLGQRINPEKTQKLKVGVSRLGSGSHIMASVLAQQEKWDHREGLDFVKCGPFKDLRDAVNISDKEQSDDSGADFFMWEHFTTKPYFHNDGSAPEKVVLKRLGEIYTPWPSWCIVASEEAFPDPRNDETITELFKMLDKGIHSFENSKEDSIKLLGTGELGCHYTEEDAKEWLKKAEFQTSGVRGVDRKMVADVVDVLKTAGVVQVDSNDSQEVQDIITIER